MKNKLIILAVLVAAFMAPQAFAWRVPPLPPSSSSSLAAPGTIGGTTPADFYFTNGYFFNSGVEHGITSIAPTNDYGAVMAMSGTIGGLDLYGLTDANQDGALRLTGIIGATDPTDSYAALVLRGGKKDGTGWQALGAAESIVEFYNYTTSVGKVYGNGEWILPSLQNTPIGGTVASTGRFTNVISTVGIGGPGSVEIAAAGGTVDAITADYNPDITLVDKTVCIVISAGANTSTTPSFAPDGVTAHTIVKAGGQALVAGDIPAAGARVMLSYDLANTRWELMNPAQSAGSGDVATDTIFDAAGDLVQGTGANTAAKLTKGAEGTILRAGAASNAYSTSTFADTYPKGTFLYAATANTIAGVAHPGAANYFLMTNAADTAAWTLGTNLSSLNGLTFADASIVQLTGAGTSSVLTSGGNNYFLGSNSDNSALEFKTPANVLSQIGAAPSSGIALTALANQAAQTINANATDGAAAPTAVEIGASQIVARLAAGNIKGASTAEMKTLLGYPTSGEYQVSDDDLAAIAALACTENQIIKRNGAGVWVCGADDNSGGIADLDDLPGDTVDNDLIDVGLVGPLGEFTGSTIVDTSTIPVALQALETAVEGKSPVAGSTSIVSYGPTAVQSVSCSDSGDANPGALTITPTAGLGIVNVEVTVLDAHGCRVMMATTGSVQNQLVVLRNVSAANTATFYSPVSYGGDPADLTFVDGGGSADTLTDSANRFVTDGFVVGMTVTITDATTAGNDGARVVTAVAAGTLTFATGSWAAGEAGAVGMTVAGTANTQLRENSPRTLLAMDAMVLQYDGSEYDEILHTTAPSFLSGTAANLPGACTKDQWYLVTDTGTKGTLYKCGGDLVFTSLVDLDATSTIPVSFTIIAPVDTDDFPIFKAPYALTIDSIHVYTVGGTSVVGGLEECTGTAGVCSGSTNVDADITGTADTDVADDGTLTNAAIASGNWIKWHTTSSTGTPTSVTVTFTYTID